MRILSLSSFQQMGGDFLNVNKHIYLEKQKLDNHSRGNVSIVLWCQLIWLHLLFSYDGWSYIQMQQQKCVSFIKSIFLLYEFKHITISLSLKK